jgi:hypothetical protein
VTNFTSPGKARLFDFAHLIDQLFNSGERRLARALLLLAHYGKQYKQQNTPVP